MTGIISIYYNFDSVIVHVYNCTWENVKQDTWDMSNLMIIQNSKRIVCTCISTFPAPSLVK